MTNGVKTRLLTPYVMIYKLQQKSQTDRPRAHRGSARLRETQSEAHRGSARLTKTQRGCERCADGPRVAPRASERVRAALSGSGRLGDAQAPGGGGGRHTKKQKNWNYARYIS